MSRVIDLEAVKRDREAKVVNWLSGPARCLDCKHEWVAASPAEVIWLECPKCSLQRGRFIGEVLKNQKHWECACGNDLFRLGETGPYCPNCGLDSDAYL